MANVREVRLAQQMKGECAAELGRANRVFWILIGVGMNYNKYVYEHK